MPRLDDTELAEFLEQPGVLVRIGTVDDDGMPRVVPTWFIHRDGQILFTPREASVFLANLRRDARVGLSIDEEPLPYRKVTVQGTATFVHDVGADDDWRDLYREIAYRYVPQEQADEYVENTIDQPRALLAVPLAGSKVTTWRMPVDDEDGTGIWHRRYYRDGTIMANIADDGNA